MVSKKAIPKRKLLLIEGVLGSLNLNPTEKEIASRLSADTRTSAIWDKIGTAFRQRHDWGIDGIERYLLQEILAVRNLINGLPDMNSYLRHAEGAENLARFLRGPGSTPWPPIVRVLGDYDEFIGSLEATGAQLRKLAERDRIKGRPLNSRVNRNDSRDRYAFMREMSRLLKDLCGQPFDEATILFTDVAFPNQQTTIDQIRAARKPTTRSSRSKNS